MQNYHWPGNVRELENVCERAVNFATGKSIGVQDLPAYLLNYAGKPSGAEPGMSMPSYRQKLRAEEDIIRAALEVAGGSKTKAASILGISRSRLYVKLKEIGLMD